MCSHYEPPTPSQLAHSFGVEPYQQGHLDLWPGYVGPFVRRRATTNAEDDASPALEVQTGAFGLIPDWSKEPKKSFEESITLGRRRLPQNRLSVTPGARPSIASFLQLLSTSPITASANRFQPESFGRTGYPWASPVCGSAGTTRPQARSCTAIRC